MSKKALILIFLLIPVIIIGIFKVKTIQYENKIEKFINNFNKKNEFVNASVEKIDCSLLIQSSFNIFDGFNQTQCLFENGIIKYTKENKEIEKMEFSKFHVDNIDEFLFFINSLNSKDSNGAFNIKGYIEEYKQKTENKKIPTFEELVKNTTSQNSRNELLANKNNVIKKIELEKKLYSNEEFLKFNNENKSNVEFDISGFFKLNIIENIKINNLKHISEETTFQLSNSFIKFFDRANFQKNIFSELNIKMKTELQKMLEKKEKEFKLITKITSVEDANLYLFRKINNKSIFSVIDVKNQFKNEFNNYPIIDEWKNELNKLIDNNMKNIELKGNNKDLDNVEKIQYNYISNGNQINENIIKKYNLKLKVY